MCVCMCVCFFFPSPLCVVSNCAPTHRTSRNSSKPRLVAWFGRPIQKLDTFTASDTHHRPSRFGALRVVSNLSVAHGLADLLPRKWPRI
uniref:Putative secreted protein n=1 Tax=Anopheles darlingi TaxID=43151 RepID=A0A2M4D0K0_ANODA